MNGSERENALTYWENLTPLGYDSRHNEGHLADAALPHSPEAGGQLPTARRLEDLVGSIRRTRIASSWPTKSESVLNQFGGAEPEVLGVVDRFVEQLRDVVVVEGIGDGASRALTVDEPEVAQQSQLV